MFISVALILPLWGKWLWIITFLHYHALNVNVLVFRILLTINVCTFHLYYQYCGKTWHISIYFKDTKSWLDEFYTVEC